MKGVNEKRGYMVLSMEYDCLSFSDVRWFIVWFWHFRMKKWVGINNLFVNELESPNRILCWSLLSYLYESSSVFFSFPFKVFWPESWRWVEGSWFSVFVWGELKWRMYLYQLFPFIRVWGCCDHPWIGNRLRNDCFVLNLFSLTG